MLAGVVTVRSAKSGMPRLMVNERARTGGLQLTGEGGHGGTARPEWLVAGRPRVVFGFTIISGKIVSIDMTADPARLSEFDLVFLDE